MAPPGETHLYSRNFDEMRMMKILLMIAFAGLLFIGFSCSSSDNEEPQIEEPGSETPEVLQQDYSYKDVYSYRSSKNIIDALYYEKLKKDENLRLLDERISNSNESRGDSIQPYRKYMNINDQYWSSMYSHISHIQDSVLKNELQVLSDSLQARFYRKVKHLKDLDSLIEAKRKSLRDKEIIMKIVVTEPMMSNFQNNEMPESRTLENINLMYDSLLQEIDPYTTINK